MKRSDRLKVELLPRLFELTDREKHHKNNRDFNIIRDCLPGKISLCVMRVLARTRYTQIIIYYNNRRNLTFDIIEGVRFMIGLT